MNAPLRSMAIRVEEDVVTARCVARQVAEVLGFDAQDQTRIATAVSELARNAVVHGGGGRVEFLLEGRRPQLLLVRISDRGPGVADVEAALSGAQRPDTGAGLGILGARRLVDRFEVASAPGQGTTITIGKLFSPRAPVLEPAGVAGLAERLAQAAPQTAIDEVRQQNQELLMALEQLRSRQEELARLTAELEDTNRGVVALYAELDEKADTLRRADQLKSRFLSNMSHEFRTPLNSMLALSALLLDDRQRPLDPEQRRQVGYIRQAAEHLSDLVNDLLDLAMVEAGKIAVRPGEVDLRTLFAALRGMLRPLLVNDAVSLVFEPPDDVPVLYTDEAKVSQILRNFLSNALKFTEAGEIRVRARLSADGRGVVCSVSDTGIGIAPEDQERIFEEFTQLDNPVQTRVRGTGLGLPLVRKLATLLGGSVSVESTVGVGSTFAATIPLVIPGAQRRPEAPAGAERPALDPARLPVLFVQDGGPEPLTGDHQLRHSRFQPVLARTVPEARNLARDVRPAALVVDVQHGADAGAFIAELRGAEATRTVPILLVMGRDDEARALEAGADACAVRPLDRGELIDALTRLVEGDRRARVLVVDDDEVSRYLVRSHLPASRFAVVEAASGTEGLRQARAERPHAIILDLVMPGMSGLDVLAHLRQDPATVDIPVVVLTSKALSREEEGALAPHATRILSKQALGRAGEPDDLLEVLLSIGAPAERADG
jgi:signal transduction histidine kinase/CheY-like chemotaxis protein